MNNHGFIYGIIVACMSIPIHITLIPVFQMTKNVGIYDSIWALIGPDVAFALPISVFILTSFMNPGPAQAVAADNGFHRPVHRKCLPICPADAMTPCPCLLAM